MVGKRIGGVNVFGGGLALYKGKKVGAVGVSGDSSCADHNIAWRVRKALGLDKVPAGVSPNKDDGIIYDIAGRRQQRRLRASRPAAAKKPTSPGRSAPAWSCNSAVRQRARGRSPGALAAARVAAIAPRAVCRRSPDLCRSNPRSSAPFSLVTPPIGKRPRANPRPARSPQPRHPIWENGIMSYRSRPGALSGHRRHPLGLALGPQSAQRPHPPELQLPDLVGGLWRIHGHRRF